MFFTSHREEGKGSMNLGKGESSLDGFCISSRGKAHSTAPTEGVNQQKGTETATLPPIKGVPYPRPRPLGSGGNLDGQSPAPPASRQEQTGSRHEELSSEEEEIPEKHHLNSES